MVGHNLQLHDNGSGTHRSSIYDTVLQRIEYVHSFSHEHPLVLLLVWHLLLDG